MKLLIEMMEFNQEEIVFYSFIIYVILLIIAGIIVMNTINKVSKDIKDEDIHKFF
jgi:hypothetical protein